MWIKRVIKLVLHVPFRLGRVSRTCRWPVRTKPCPSYMSNTDNPDSTGERAAMAQHKIVRQPLDDLLLAPGKGIRERLIQAFNEWLAVPQDKLSIINNIIELLHTASLLIDDIQDGSELRRGLPAAHLVYGIARTINSANYAYFLAQKELTKLDAGSFDIFTEELLSLHLGQGMELHWRDTGTCPSEDEYMEMVSNKTGGLFRLAARLMQLESPQPRDLVPLANILGMIYQIRDDYLNLQDSSYSDPKCYCGDLTEGKFSFPVIHSIRLTPDDDELLRILRQRSNDDNTNQRAVQCMERTDTFTYCRYRLSLLIEEAGSIARAMGKEDNLKFMEILEYLHV